MTSPNNYVDKSNISCPDYKLNLHTDYVTLTKISLRYYKQLCDLLDNNGFKLVYDKPLKRGKFGKKRKYEDETVSIEVFYDFKVGDVQVPEMMIKIHDPNQGVLNLIDLLFIKLSINYRVKQVELTFDFTTNYPNDLKDYLNNHLFLRHHRLPSFRFKTTYYTTNIRKSSKGTRTYIKQLNGCNVVRLELVLNNRIIRKLSLKLPFDSLKMISFSDYFTFKSVNAATLLKHLKWKHKEAIAKAYNKSRMSGGLKKRIIESYVSSVISDYYHLMEQVERIKSDEKGLGITAYDRFMVEHHDFVHKFNEEVSAQSFIPCGSKVYSLPSNE